MANTRISDLTASASNLASTDLAPVVQTVGVGPVKMTGLQLAGGLLGSATFNGATVTTSQPVLNLTQTWNDGAVTFTGLRFNAAGSSDANSASGSLLLDLQVGGSSKFKVDKAGNVTAVSDTVSVINATSQISLNNTSIGFTNSAATLANNIPLGWSSSGVWYGTVDTILTRAAAAALQLGAADTTGTTAPTAQFLRVQSWSSSTTNNQTGANFTIQGSRGTGTGAGGSIIFQVAPAGGSSNGVQNAYSTALTIDSTKLATFASNVTAGNNNFKTDYGWLGNGRGDGGCIIPGGSHFAWVSSANIASDTVDVRLYRDTSNTLALRNGTNAQTFNVYNTYTDASNYERLRIVAQSANSVIIGTQKAGTGTARALALQTDGTTRLTIETNGDLTIADAENIIVGSTTGTKIGTATSQKIGFWNATPIVQPTTGVAEAAFVENSGGTAVNVDSTFGGYTLQQVVQALQNAGLLA